MKNEMPNWPIFLCDLPTSLLGGHNVHAGTNAKHRDTTKKPIITRETSGSRETVYH